MICPEATFDALAITASLRPTLGRVLPSEVHLFAYLSCLLSLYSGRPVVDWGYEFTSTAEGAPYSVSMDRAITLLRNSSDMESGPSGLSLSSTGVAEYELLRTISGNEAREKYVAGACSSVLAIPVGVVRAALGQEPALRRVSSLSSTRPLLQNVDLSVLYDQFEALSSALGPTVRDVMVPAVTWLTFLVRSTLVEPKPVANHQRS